MEVVLISALTAAVVTLLIEYTAKPHLDARKDRIAETYRSRRELISKIYFLSENFPPIAGVGSVVQEEDGIAVVGKFLDDGLAIWMDFLRHHSSLSRRQQLAAKFVMAKLLSALKGGRKLLGDYRSSSSADIEFRNFVDEELGNLVRFAVRDALRIRSLLTLSRWRPFRYYRVTREMMHISLDLDESSHDASRTKSFGSHKSEA